MRARDPLESFNEKWLFEPNSGCYLWMAQLDSKGYGRFRTRSSKERLAHRFSWIFEHGSIPEKMHILHKCDTPGCVRPDHLFLGTNDDNVKDKVKKGRQATCERHSSSKLTACDVLSIREDNRDQHTLAAIYGVDESTIRGVKTRKYWRAV